MSAQRRPTDTERLDWLGTGRSSNWWYSKADSALFAGRHGAIRDAIDQAMRADAAYVGAATDEGN